MATPAAIPTAVTVGNNCPAPSCSKALPRGKSYCDSKCEIDWLKAQNAQLAANQAKPKAPAQITVRRSKPEGTTQGNAVCIYGLGKYPITLYREQAERLFTPEVIREVLAIASTLTRKNGQGEAQAQGGRF